MGRKAGKFLVCGQGYNDGKYTSSAGNIKTLQYIHWVNMIHRCYSGKYKTYEDVTASDNFKNYSYFYEWCLEQKGFGNQGWALDKDMIVKGNRQYSESTCCFIPQSINSLMGNRRKTTDESIHLPIGVVWRDHAHKYRAYFTPSDSRKQIHLGYFDTPEDAFEAHKEVKEVEIKRVANEWKGLIDDRVYESLMNWEITPYG